MKKIDFEAKYPSLNFRDEFRESKQMLNSFNCATSELKSIVDDPLFFISNCNIDLRNQVNIERELAKKSMTITII